MRVSELIEKLKEMPQDAQLAIEVSACYYENSDLDVIDEPWIENGYVYIGSVYAQP